MLIFPPLKHIYQYSLYKNFEELLIDIIYDVEKTPTHHVRIRLKEMGRLPETN